MVRLRRLAWRAICGLLFWSGILPAALRLRRRRAPGSWTLLAYHRVAEPGARGSAPGPGAPSRIAARRFRRHLRFLKSRYTIVTVGEALARRSAGRRDEKPLLSLTFDDGYRDNVVAALPILQQEGCVATLYATLEAAADGLPPWTHRLGVDLRASGCPAAEAAEIVARAKQLPDAERAEICRAAERASGGAGRRGAAMARADDLRRWCDAGMELGSHTVSHRILARLDGEDLRRELEESRAGLEALGGAPVRHLAYPNGAPGDWNAATAQAADAAGYLSAVTTEEGTNEADADPFRLRRVSMGDDTLAVCAARLLGLGAGLRQRLRRGAAPAGRALPDAADRPLSIAFIGGRGVGRAYSGIERYYEEIGSRLAARGHRVVAYSRSHFSPRVRTYRGVEVRRIPTLRSKHLETLLHTVLSTLDVCFRRVDIVQFHALGSSPFAWIPRLLGKKTVVSVRGLDWQRAKWGAVARTCLRLCEASSVICPDATVVVSRTLKTYFEARFRRSVHFIPNGVSGTTKRPADTIKWWGLSPRGYFLYAGRLSPEKGLEGLIVAHRGVARDCPLVLAGGSSYSEEYMAKLRRLAGSRVIFTGFLTGRMLEEIYGNALAFVLPSQMEGLSVAMLEAMSYGLPVIASDIPENREVVDACGGYLFKLDDTAALAGLLERIVGDRGAALGVGERARARVREHFDWDRVADDTEQFYRGLAGRPAARGAPARADAPAA